MQTFIQMLHNEYIRFSLATMLICIAVIAVWLLLRHVRLWYNETGSVLEALDTISFRLEHVEDKLGIANQDTLGISENIYVIGSITEESRAIQMAIRDDMKSSKESHEKIAEEINGIHGLLLADPIPELQKEFSKETDHTQDHTGRDFGEITRQHDDQKLLYRNDEVDDDEEEEYDDIEELWLEDLDDIFPEDDEEEIRKKIRL